MIVKLVAVSIITAILVGCSATHTAINKRTLDVQTKMSSTVFLDPVTSDKHTVFLQLRNTSGKPELNLTHCMAEAIESRGYRIVSTPEEAHYLLQTNVLQVGKSDLKSAEQALNQGFGAAFSGGVVGAAVGSLGSQRSDYMVVGGLLGAAVSTVADAMVQDVVYSVVADVQLSERVGNSVMVTEKTKSKLKQGTSGIKEVTSTEKINWKRYQTRIVSTANKVNLSFEKAAPELMRGITHSIAGVF